MSSPQDRFPSSAQSPTPNPMFEHAPVDPERTPSPNSGRKWVTSTMQRVGCRAGDGWPRSKKECLQVAPEEAEMAPEGREFPKGATDVASGERSIVSPSKVNLVHSSVTKEPHQQPEFASGQATARDMAQSPPGQHARTQSGRLCFGVERYPSFPLNFLPMSDSVNAQKGIRDCPPLTRLRNPKQDTGLWRYIESR